MKNIFKLRYIFLIIFISTGSILILLFLKNSKLKKIEKKELNDQTELIKKCIDIENKNLRNFRENIKLIEYCLDKFNDI